MQGLLQHILDNKAKEENETRVFYLKMKGDYYRYLAEVFKDNKGALIYNVFRMKLKC